MLRSIAELAAYGALAALLTAASLTPETGTSSATTSVTASTSDATTSADLSPAAERGASLFALKGCIGCHMHSAFPKARMQIGPDLTGLADRAGSRVAGLDAAAYVRQSLREPGVYRASASTVVMPDLGLTDAQIESLTAFLLTSAR
jgi:mono/diheme cytochrome c family protein